MGVGLDLFGGLVCVTSVEKDKFPTENFPEIKGSHREISGGKYTTERKETSSCPNFFLEDRDPALSGGSWHDVGDGLRWVSTLGRSVGLRFGAPG